MIWCFDRLPLTSNASIKKERIDFFEASESELVTCSLFLYAFSLHIHENTQTSVHRKKNAIIKAIHEKVIPQSSY